MSEDRTPIEELIDCYKVAAHYKTWETFLQQLPSVLNVLLEKDKTHREKYKHTKEDVIEANYSGIKLGWKDAVNEFKYPTKVMIPKSTDALAEQYYNETHKNQD